MTERKLLVLGVSEDVVVQAVAESAISQPGAAAVLEHTSVWPAAPSGSLGAPAPSRGVVLVAVRPLVASHPLPLARSFTLLGVSGLGCRPRCHLGRRLLQHFSNLRLDGFPHGEGHALLLMRGLLPVKVVPLARTVLVREAHLAGSLGPGQGKIRLIQHLFFASIPPSTCRPCRR